MANSNNKTTTAKIKKMTREFENDIQLSMNFLGTTIFNIAQNNGGKVPTASSRQMQDAFELALNGSAFSIKDVRNTINKKITKLKEKEGIDPKKFSNVEKKLTQAEKSISDVSRSDDKIKAFLAKRVKKIYLGNAIAVKNMAKQKKDILIDKLESKLNLPEATINFAIDRTKKIQTQEITSLIKNKINELFTQKGPSFDPSKGFPTIDNSKLTKENFEKFQNSIKSTITSYSIIQDSLDFLRHKKSINKNTNDKIINKLMPALQKLGPEYLERHPNISKEIAEAISRKKTFASIFRRRLSISSKNLDKIGKEIVSKYLEDSKKLEFETKIGGVIIKKGLSNNEIADKLNNIYMKNSKNVPEKLHSIFKNNKIDSKGVNNLTNSDLVMIRRENPTGFDRVFNNSSPQNSTKVISNKLKKQVRKKQSISAKATQSRTKKLGPALNKPLPPIPVKKSKTPPPVPPRKNKKSTGRAK